MAALALSGDEIVNASNQPFVSAMPIAFVIRISRSKVNVVLAKSMAGCHIRLKVGILFDLSITPGKFEFPIRSNLLAQKTAEPVIMKLNQVIVVHFELFDATVYFSDLVVIINDLENLTSFQVTRVWFASSIFPPLVV